MDLVVLVAETDEVEQQCVKKKEKKKKKNCILNASTHTHKHARVHAVTDNNPENHQRALPYFRLKIMLPSLNGCGKLS